MSQKDVLRRWEESRQGLRKLAEGIPEGKEGFRPAPETMSLGELVLHCVSAEKTAVDALTGAAPKWEWNQGLDLAHYPTKKDILGALDRQTAATKRYLEGLSDADLAKKVKLPWGAEMTLDDFWHEWMFHEVHHRGNLVTGLRVAGVTPPNIW